MELSNRLETIASFVTEGYVVADIGTDHGYIPIYLTKNGNCPRAYAMDVNKAVQKHILKKRMQEKPFPAFFLMDCMNYRKMKWIPL